MVAPAYFADLTPSRYAASLTALITGASFGIGYELARLFARDGYNLELVARSREKLQKFAEELRTLGKEQINVTVISRDLADLEAPEDIFDATERAKIDVDVLVNNAAFGKRGPFAKTDIDDDLDMMQLNVVAMAHLTRLYLPGMLMRAETVKRTGRILQIASTAAFVPGPMMALYYASKAFVLSFSEALAEELKGTRVTVTCLCPGPTATEFSKRAGTENTNLFKGRVMDAKTVAEMGYRGMMRGEPIVIAGMRNRLMIQSLRFSPRWLVRKMVKKIQE
jgi:short-subunit dehydrogenase